MRILITGGAGFIGSNLTKRCLSEGFTVDVVDDLSNGHIHFVPRQIIDKDGLILADFASDGILENIRQKKYDVVVHLAAQPRVSYSVEHPYETHQTNVTATMRLIDVCRGNVKRFVFASSSSVYGGASKLPTNINENCSPKSPYALQKLIIEDYLRLFHNLYGFDSVCLRFFNVFGPHQLGDSPYATAVSAWLNAIMKNESMRSDGDGSQTRDMCHVDNVVEACVKAATSQKLFGGHAFNVACGQKTSNMEILQYLLKKFPNAKFHSAPWRLGDVMHTLADISITSSELGYQPKVMFWEGLDTTIQWYQDNWEKIKDLSSK